MFLLQLWKLFQLSDRAGPSHCGGDLESMGGFEEIDLDSEEESEEAGNIHVDAEMSGEDEGEVRMCKGPVTCPECNHNTMKWGPVNGTRALRTHVKENHTSKFDEIMAVHQRRMEEYEEYRRPVKETDTVCEDCGGPFSQKSTYNRHKRNGACQRAQDKKRRKGDSA